MNDVRIIKRYQNRKLYDTFQSCYVTLEEIAQIIREGNDIKVIDNRNKTDITYITQIQLLFDQEKKHIQPADSDLLKTVIRSKAGTFTGYIKELSGIEDVAPAVESTPVVEPATMVTPEASTPASPLN